MTGNNKEPIKAKKDNSDLSEELADKIIRGDSGARNAFVKTYYKWLLFVVRKKFSRSNNHEDIVQDSFILVIENLKQGKINNPKTILAYLRTTAINIGFSYLRKDKKFTSAISQDYMEVIADSSDDILSRLIWNNKIEYIKQIMNELKIKRDKELLLKFYLEDQSKVDICQVLDLSPEHFDRVHYRAKKRLVELIESKNNTTGKGSGYQTVNSKGQRENKKTSFMSRLRELSLKWVFQLVLTAPVSYFNRAKVLFRQNRRELEHLRGLIK